MIRNEFGHKYVPASGRMLHAYWLAGRIGDRACEAGVGDGVIEYRMTPSASGWLATEEVRCSTVSGHTPWMAEGLRGITLHNIVRSETRPDGTSELTRNAILTIMELGHTAFARSELALPQLWGVVDTRGAWVDQPNVWADRDSREFVAWLGVVNSTLGMQIPHAELSY